MLPDPVPPQVLKGCEILAAALATSFLVGCTREDLRQEGLLAWLTRCPQHDQDRANANTFASYLIAWGIHEARRRATHRGHQFYVPLSTAPIHFLITPPVESGAWLRRAVNRLPARQRYILIRFYWSGWSQRHIARALHTSEATVSVDKSHALRTLRTYLR